MVHDGRAALEQIRRRRPDLLVLDVMMPKVDGLDVCRILRRESDLPVLMLTARPTEDDLLLGLDLGADDYMTKPYSPRELVARVRTPAAPARRRAAGATRCCGSARLDVDPVRHEVAATARRSTARRASSSCWRRWPPQPGRVFTRDAAAAATCTGSTGTSPTAPSTCT